MNVKALTLAASTAPLFITGTASSAFVGLAVRLIDPTTQVADHTGQPYGNGSWADNGYVGLDTYRVHAMFTTPDSVLAVGDTSAGGPAMHLSTDAPTFFNAVGAFGNNGLRAPTNFAIVPEGGPAFYESQWDSYLVIDHLSSVSLAPGLTTALGATSMGMGGLVGNSFSIDNTGWSTTPAGNNTTFNPASGFHESMILQLTVPDNFGVWGDGIRITSSTTFLPPASFHSGPIPVPGAIALLGLAGLSARTSRRRARAVTMLARRSCN